MNKTLFDNFTSKILIAGPILQFILIVGFNNVHFYYDTNPNVTVLFACINLVGYWALSSWLYSIAYVSNFHIEQTGKVFPNLKFMEVCIVLNFLLDVGMIFVKPYISRVDLGFFNFTYSEPFELALVNFLSGVFSIIYVAKILIFAETHKDVGFSGYYKTALLLLFPIVGIWLINNRLERLKLIKKFEGDSDDETDEGNPNEFDSHKLREAIENEATLTKVEYKCKQGVIAIYQEHSQPNVGEKIFLNNKRAADGKYKIGFMNCVTVSDGKISKLGMF